MEDKAITQVQRSQYYGTQVQEFGKKYPSFHWPSVEILLNLIYTYDSVCGRLERYLHKYGLSRAAFNVLMIVLRSEGLGCKQQDISKLLLVSRANITGLVDGLVRQGLVVRTAHAYDRRAHVIQLSSKGQKLLDAMLPEYYKFVRELGAALSSAQKRELNGLLFCLRQDVERG